MSTSIASSSFDQASGLRELFASMPAAETSVDVVTLPSVYALVCPSRPSLTLPLAEVCHQLMRQRQRRHAWIDELDFEDRENWPMPCPVRFDLGQSMANHVPLSASMQSLDKSVAWYASARRISPTLQSPSLAHRLAQSGLDFESVIVCAAPSSQRPWSQYGPVVTPVVICETSDEATDSSLHWLREQARTGGLNLSGCHWVLLGNLTDTHQIRDKINHSWQALYGVPPHWAGQSQLERGEPLLPLAARWQELAKDIVDQIIHP